MSKTRSAEDDYRYPLVYRKQFWAMIDEIDDLRAARQRWISRWVSSRGEIPADEEAWRRQDQIKAIAATCFGPIKKSAVESRHKRRDHSMSDTNGRVR